MRRGSIWCAVAGVMLAGSAAAAQTPGCGAQPRCAEVASFTATVTDFRTSNNGRTKVITATVRFQNRLNRPLTLGYVEGSGLATDDQGNRYVLYGEGAVRAMGVISRQSLDPKFVLEPGQWSDARFEMYWNPGREIIGLRFDMEMAIRELIPVQGRQYRLGLEHAIQFRGLGDAPAPVSQTAPAPAAAQPAATATAAPAAPAVPQQDLCAGKPKCSHPGPFVAEVQNITSALSGTYQDHVVRINVQFRNVSDQPMILGYSAKSSKMVDDLGNEYHWGQANTYDRSVTGMGVVESRNANADFVLQPGQQRMATFQLVRYSTARKQLGMTFTWDFAVEELRVLPSNQITTGRQYSLNFQNLEIRPPTGAGAAATGGRGSQRQQTPAESMQQLKDLFKKKK